MKREKEKEKDSKTVRVEQQQIFTSTAATGVLTNDLLKIMDESDKLVRIICNGKFNIGLFVFENLRADRRFKRLFF